MSEIKPDPTTAEGIRMTTDPTKLAELIERLETLLRGSTPGEAKVSMGYAGARRIPFFVLPNSDGARFGTDGDMELHAFLHNNAALLLTLARAHLDSQTKLADLRAEVRQARHWYDCDDKEQGAAEDRWLAARAQTDKSKALED